LNKKVKKVAGYAAEAAAMLVFLWLFYAYQTDGLLPTGEQAAPKLSATSTVTVTLFPSEMR